MLSDAQTFYVEKKLSGIHTQDILGLMMRAGYSDLDRITALRTIEHLSLKDAKAIKEISECWIGSTITRDVYTQWVNDACRDNPEIAKYFRLEARDEENPAASEHRSAV